MKIKYYVITKINEGNYYTPFAFKKDGKLFIDDNLSGKEVKKHFDLNTAELGKVYANVFTIGEIMIMDSDHGREVDGAQRAPRKWNVEWQEFDHIEDAITCAKKTFDKWLETR